MQYRMLRTQPEFLKMIAANMVNRFGDSLDSIAWSLLMYRVTGSAAMMALVMAINYLPTIILQPIAGALVDRMNKQKLMVWCDIGRCILVALMAALHLLGWLNTPLILLSVVGCSTLESLRVPAGVAIVPSLLSEELYPTGVALNNSLSRICEIVGLALAGAVVGLIGNAGALLIDAATFLLSALCIARIRSKAASTPANTAAKGVRSVLQSMLEGFRYICKTPTLLALLLFGMTLNLSNVPYSVFATAYLTDSLGFSPELMSVLNLASTGAAAIGAFLSPKLPCSRKTQAVVCGALTAAVYLVLRFLPDVPFLTLRFAVMFGMMLVFGITGAVLSVIFSVVFRKFVDAAYLGRVSGVTNAILTCAMPLGSLACSGLATVLTVPQMMWVGCGLTSAVFAVIAGLKIYRQM